MIVLDTNVISALMRDRPDPVAVAWLDRQPADAVWTTTISVFELQFGIELLAPGWRRRQIEAAFAAALNEDFKDRVLPFDQDAARQTAIIAARRRQSGRSVDFRDSQIAGIVVSRGAKLVTRNLRHFADLAVEVINPWDEL